MKAFLSAFSALAVAVALLMPMPKIAAAQEPGYSSLYQTVGYRGDRRWRGGRHYGHRGHYRPGRYYGPRYRHHRHGPSFEIIIGGGIPYYRPPYYRPPVRRYIAPPIRPAYGVGRGHVEWCYARYRSYRAYDNTFQPYHGPRRSCVSPYY